ncbi:MAG: hypothetical protein CL852_00290 [Crocinitomicaceae bacterium]|nr:hypothetical protein [Crocinitomicaceae bacterium]
MEYHDQHEVMKILLYHWVVCNLRSFLRENILTNYNYFLLEFLALWSMLIENFQMQVENIHLPLVLYKEYAQSKRHYFLY